ncbi:pyruvate dehydrogenase complex, E1 component, pyruvate dehydrogenase, beta subunit [Plesiocystis pacifica SIR-1]|uniref:Pyruvate dehydrogenase complex, E1 component, pyruvate dehydrogenase, beta subunit n=1 Tax=Plesiocystis pacifica SIR-1 TaxID=391625 RepID=A6GG25_9BACT|nr:pyruvate dehydrogenase complex E1 component subunit beta [Plesiocystis pacifica]EDM75153.1 pyruvate dehydrogenase complex, E1 component, pyruvate dehydrogenase, beta subunit [Plesiocystis pacifica SIR-1]
MANLQIREAIRDAMREEMERDERVFLMGEEVGHYQGAYKCSQGLLEQFGAKRVVDTPITETGFSGVGIGAAMVGLRPIIEFMTFNFSAVAFDQILNNASKIHHMTGGQFSVPIVFRGPNAAAHMLGSTHSQAFDGIYAHIPGLKVVSVATPYDAKGLLKSAIRDPNPVIFFESELMYAVRGEVPEEEYLIPIGEADIKRPGEQVTLITWGQSVPTSLEAAKLAEADGLDVEVIDLRTLRPLDEAAVIHSVKKTNRAVIAYHGWPYGGVGAELVDRIQRMAFDWLDAPVERVCYDDIPFSYAENLEHLSIPQPEDIYAACRKVAYR